AARRVGRAMLRILARCVSVVAVVALGTFGLASCGPPIERLNEPGSGALQDVSAALAALYNGSSQSASDNAKWDAPPTTFDGEHPAPFTVPGDGHCGAVTYNASNPPPGGSLAAIFSLRNSDEGGTAGCVDMARSTIDRDSNPTISSDLELWVFARDA